jgi:hypothetical protein
MGMTADDPELELSEPDSTIIKRHQIMSHYHWSYQDYQITPAHVIEECYALIKTESKATKDKYPENKNG